MSELAVLHRESDTLSQHRVGEVLDEAGMDEPNEETIAAIEETRAMVRGEIPSPTFHSLEELLADLRS